MTYAISACLTLATLVAPIQEPASDPHFPVPTEGLHVVAEGDGAHTVADLLREFCRVADQNISASDSTRKLFTQTAVGLLSDVDVPAGEVYSFVESILMERGFMVTELRSTAPRLLGIVRLDERDAQNNYALVSSDKIAMYDRHPALAVETYLHLPWVDVRQLGNSLRTLTPDTRFLSCIPLADTSSILVRGNGSTVARLSKLLTEVNEKSRVRVERLQREARERAEAEKKGELEAGGK